MLLSGGLSGRASRSWRGERQEADFFAAKALLEGLLDRFGLRWSVEAGDAWPFLHPGRSATVLASPSPGSAFAGAESAPEPVRLGFLGELHPLVADAWDLQRAATFAVDLGKLADLASPLVEFVAFGPFPPLRQDLAVTLPDSVSAEDALERVRAAARGVLEEARVFDVYSGEQVGEGRRSLALALSFRSREGTLTDEDVAPVREKIVTALAALGGELRG